MRISKHARDYARKVVQAITAAGVQLDEADVSIAFEKGMRFERTLQKATDPESPATAAHAKAPGSE